LKSSLRTFLVLRYILKTYIDRLVIPDVKNDIIQGAGKLDQKDITLRQGKSTDMPPNQKSKTS
jgi:hypothetical protein